MHHAEPHGLPRRGEAVRFGRGIFLLLLVLRPCPARKNIRAFRRLGLITDHCAGIVVVVKWNRYFGDICLIIM